MDKTLTIVLPTYNRESELRASVLDVLEIASELTSNLSVLVIDDGSTDSTYEIACELSVEFPQVAVARQRVRSGLGSSLRMAREMVQTDVVLVHDGVSSVDMNHLRRLWKQVPANHEMEQMSPVEELRTVLDTHTPLEQVHSKLLSFQLLRNGEVETTPRAEPLLPQPSEMPYENGPASPNVGKIPTLPRPNFLGALANFALGE